MSQSTQKSNHQKDAEADVESFRRNLGPFVVAADTTRMAMVFADATAPHNPIIFANDSFLRLTGYERADVLGKSFDFFMAHCADAEALKRIQREFEGASECGTEVLYRRKDGSEFWAGLFVSRVLNEQDQLVQYFASFVDLTRHKEDETRSKRLIEELNHRVKNTLATVQAIVRQATRRESGARVIREDVESRLFALSRSHDLLERDSWQSAGLFDVVANTLEPFGAAEGRSDRIVIRGENIRFSPQQVLALGIVFNELATKAVKYGALSNETGAVLIAWARETVAGADRLVLRWSETGGPPRRATGKQGIRVARDRARPGA